MKIQPYVTKLHSSPVFKDFQEKYADAFLVAGFFVIDFESGKNLHQIDYYVPSKKKFAAFTLDNKIVMQLMNTMERKAPKELDMKSHIDLDALQGIIQDEMKNRSITQSIKKMIAILQNIEGKKVWNINCVLSGMDLLKVHVEDESETILKMEKSSLLDYIKRLPMQPGQAAPPADATAATAQTMQGDPQQIKPTKEMIEKKIEQLDKLKELLKKEEVELDQPAPQKQAAAKPTKAAKKPKKK